MPLTLVDRLPLPNFKVYSSASVALLTAAVFYAASVTSDPNWRMNSTMQQHEVPEPPDSVPLQMMKALYLPSENITQGTYKSLSDQMEEIMSFMLQEPLCMWTLVNVGYCALALGGLLLQRVVFGPLYNAEAKRLRDTFWHLLFYKFIFIFGVVDVTYMDEVLLWSCWFSVLGFVQLLMQLCKGRFEYVTLMADTMGMVRVRRLKLAALLAVLAVGTALLCGAAVRLGLPAGLSIFAFMMAECILIVLDLLHLAAKYVLIKSRADAAGAVVYYTHFVFDMCRVCVEGAHVAHMAGVAGGGGAASPGALVLLLRLRRVLRAGHARLAKHAAYTTHLKHYHSSYSIATAEELELNSDHCAICWDTMSEARKLPCSHLFHNSCLFQWVQQDASCPTCRRPLLAPPPAPPARTSSVFTFTGSRYLWLPGFSVEVTRSPVELSTSQTELMARQVQAMFPQYSLSSLLSDLAFTRDTQRTIDNILEGRLLAEEQLEEDDAPETQENIHTPSQFPWRPEPSTSVSDQEPLGSPAVPARSQFLEESVARERELSRRMNDMVERARRRYLHAASERHVVEPQPPPAS